MSACDHRRAQTPRVEGWVSSFQPHAPAWEVHFTLDGMEGHSAGYLCICAACAVCPVASSPCPGYLFLRGRDGAQPLPPVPSLGRVCAGASERGEEPGATAPPYALLPQTLRAGGAFPLLLLHWPSQRALSPPAPGDHRLHSRVGSGGLSSHPEITQDEENARRRARAGCAGGRGGDTQALYLRVVKGR